jgi:hypothetical protein
MTVFVIDQDVEVATLQEHILASDKCSAQKEAVKALFPHAEVILAKENSPLGKALMEAWLSTCVNRSLVR